MADGMRVSADNGFQFVAVRMKGRRSLCAVRQNGAVSACGELVTEEAEFPLGTNAAWVGAITEEFRSDELRPCPDCVAAFGPTAQPGSKKYVYKDVPEGTPGAIKYKHSDGSAGWATRKEVRTHQAVTDRRGANVDRFGQTEDAAERLNDVRARLGVVVPLLSTGEDESGPVVLPASLVRVGKGKGPFHAAARVGEGWILVCRAGLVPVAQEGKSRAALKCKACRELLFTMVVRRGEGGTVRTWKREIRSALVRDRDGSDRFRPIGGVPEKSPSEVRPADPIRLDNARRESDSVLPVGFSGDHKAERGQFRAVNFGPWKGALEGWSHLRMGLPCGESCGCATGWEHARATENLPTHLWREMDRFQKSAAKQGVSFVNAHRAKRRAAREAGAQRAEYIGAMSAYVEARAFGAEDRAPARVGQNPYPRPGRVYDEFR